jgi:hypothetical protein
MKECFFSKNSIAEGRAPCKAKRAPSGAQRESEESSDFIIQPTVDFPPNDCIWILAPQSFILKANRFQEQQ